MVLQHILNKHCKTLEMKEMARSIKMNNKYETALSAEVLSQRGKGSKKHQRAEERKQKRANESAND